MLCVLPYQPARFFMHAFICPRCHMPLRENARGLTCEQGHHLDRAKEGYVNFLLAHHKHSRDPGDARLQLDARRHFLHAGYYRPLLDAVRELLHVPPGSLLDIGCGEGYFTRGLAAALPAEANVYGLDISKAGIRLAARHVSPVSGAAIHYGVASGFNLPLADQSMDMITRINAPADASELKRLLRSDGRLVIVSPADSHLQGLRSRIYQQVRPHPQPVAPDGFMSSGCQRVSHSLDVAPGEDTQALLQMTPFAWRLTDELRGELVETGLSDRVDFHVSVYSLIP